MPVPKYQEIMEPLLRLASDGEEHSLAGTYDELANHFQLSDGELRELLPSGRQPTFNNRVGWAKTYLIKAGLLKSTRRAHFQITQRGRDVLQANPGKINTALLYRFDEFIDFRSRSSDDEAEEAQLIEASPESPEESTPEEGLLAAYERIRSELAEQLLSAVLEMTPLFFERLVVDLLVRMGYGGTLRDAGQAIGQAGDGGIDGIIKEDRLGLDVVYIQAKRWAPTQSVSRPEIQKFAGALQGVRARKGVFITTSRFTKGARDYVSRIDSRIVLVDGEMLSELMIDHGLGVSTVATYEHKTIDSDYFAP